MRSLDIKLIRSAWRVGLQIKAKCATMEARSKQVLSQVLKIAKTREVEVRKGSAVIRFLAQRLLHSAIKDAEVAVAVHCYLPELHDRLRKAEKEGRPSPFQVNLQPQA